MSLSNFVLLWATLWYSYYTKSYKEGTKVPEAIASWKLLNY